jgi:hypothetical protein
MELHDKIISSTCESKLADFVMFVSSVYFLIFTGQMELLTSYSFLSKGVRELKVRHE